MRSLRGGFFGVTYDPIGGGRAQRSLSPDAGRGADADPTTLLTRFAEELRRAPGAGGGGDV